MEQSVKLLFVFLHVRYLSSDLKQSISLAGLIPLYQDMHLVQLQLKITMYH